MSNRPPFLLASKLVSFIVFALVKCGSAQAQCNPDEIAKLLASDGAGGDSLGQSVALSGNFALLGAPWNDDNGSNDGAAYLYQNSGGIWQEVTKLGVLGTTTGEFFGWSVAISGNTALIGARYDTQNGGLAGAAYIFRETSPGNWTQIAKLLPDDGAAGDEFGWRIDLDGTTAISPDPDDCPADIAPAPDGDGVVNVVDLLMVIGNWS